MRPPHVRAQYLAQNGWTKFFQWFDYKVWYPLGRPVGTTIYPGMQISSVVIWKVRLPFRARASSAAPPPRRPRPRAARAGRRCSRRSARRTG